MCVCYVKTIKLPYSLTSNLNTVSLLKVIAITRSNSEAATTLNCSSFADTLSLSNSIHTLPVLQHDRPITERSYKASKPIHLGM